MMLPQYWSWGDHVPFQDDHLVPRSRKALVEHPEDLGALPYLLVPPVPEEVDACRRTLLIVANGLQEYFGHNRIKKRPGLFLYVSPCGLFGPGRPVGTGG